MTRPDAPDAVPRRALVVGAVVQAVLAIAVGIAAAAGMGLGMPVTATFRPAVALDASAAAVVPIASVDLAWAVAALLAGGAVVYALAASGRAPAELVLAGGWSQGAGVLVFLVAQLNGITEVAALVPLYALAATAVLLVAIDVRNAPTWRRPASWAAVAGIVPWGVIAFAQIGAGLTSGTVALPLGTRIVTLVALAVAILGWILGRRADLRRGIPIMTAGVCLVGVLLALGAAIVV